MLCSICNNFMFCVIAIILLSMFVKHRTKTSLAMFLFGCACFAKLRKYILITVSLLTITISMKITHFSFGRWLVFHRSAGLLCCLLTCYQIVTLVLVQASDLIEMFVSEISKNWNIKCSQLFMKRVEMDGMRYTLLFSVSMRCVWEG